MSASDRLRRIGASVLLVLAGLGVMLTGLSTWLDREFLETDNFVSLTDQLLDSEEVRAGITKAVVDELENAGGRPIQIAAPFLTPIIDQIIQSDQFQEIFERAVQTAHRVVVARDVPQVVLNLSGVLDDLRTVLEEVAPDLAEDIPTGESLQIQLGEETGLRTVWDVLDIVDRVLLAIPFVTAAALVGGMLLSPRRWRGLALVVFVSAAATAFLLLAVLVGRVVLAGQISDSTFRAAAESVYDIVTQGLVVQLIVTAVLAAGLGFGASWGERNGGLAAFRRLGQRAVDRVRRVELPDLRVPGGATTGATAMAIRAVQWRLPEPSGDRRVRHWLRAGALGALGLFAFLRPDSLTDLIVVLAGLGLMWLAVTEALAASRIPHEGDKAGASPAAG